jgi:hypothetical protein
MNRQARSVLPRVRAQDVDGVRDRYLLLHDNLLRCGAIAAAPRRRIPAGGDDLQRRAPPWR